MSNRPKLKDSEPKFRARAQMYWCSGEHTTDVGPKITASKAQKMADMMWTVVSVQGPPTFGDMYDDDKRVPKDSHLVKLVIEQPADDDWIELVSKETTCSHQ